MSWAEEQSWFGLEDLAIEALREQEMEYVRDIEIEYIAYPAWRMNDGNLIAIKDMETSHIKNCIKMIYRRNGNWRHQYLRLFETELRKRKLKTPLVIYG